MRTRYWRALLLAGVLFVLAGAGVQAAEVVYLTSGEWPPYLSSRLSDEGFAAHVVREAFRAVGVEVRYSYYPWPRAYAYASHGHDGHGHSLDGTVVWGSNAEREREFWVSDVVLRDSDVFFFRRDTGFDWTEINDLAGLIFGGTSDKIHPRLEAAEQAGWLKIERSGDYDTLLKRLLRCRVNAVPMLRRVGLYYLRLHLSPEDRANIVIHPRPLQTREYHLLLSRQRPDGAALLERFNRGLSMIRANGLYGHLVERLEADGYDPPGSPPSN